MKTTRRFIAGLSALALAAAMTGALPAVDSAPFDTAITAGAVDQLDLKDFVIEQFGHFDTDLIVAITNNTGQGAEGFEDEAAMTIDGKDTGLTPESTSQDTYTFTYSNGDTSIIVYMTIETDEVTESTSLIVNNVEVTGTQPKKVILSAREWTSSNDTVINPTGGDPFDVTPDPDRANTEVEFSVDPAYTVTIPAKVELTKDTALNKYTGSGTLTAENVFLKPHQMIVVTLSGDFVLENEADSSVTMGYEAVGFYGTINAQNSGRAVKIFGTSAEPQTFDVNFSTVDDPEYAGTYSDTVTFGISVETSS